MTDTIKLSGSGALSADVLRTLLDAGVIMPGYPHISTAAMAAAGYTDGGGGIIPYYPGLVGSGQSTSARPIDTLFAQPFIVQSAGVIAQIGGTVTVVAVGSTVRYAIYASDPSNAYYPTTLLFDSGEIDSAGATGFKSANCSVPVKAGQLLWLVYRCAVLAPTVITMSNTIGASNTALPILGYFQTATGAAAFNGITKASSGALLATFPAAAQLSSGATVQVMVRYA